MEDYSHMNFQKNCFELEKAPIELHLIWCNICL